MYNLLRMRRVILVGAGLLIPLLLDTPFLHAQDFKFKLPSLFEARQRLKKTFQKSQSQKILPPISDPNLKSVDSESTDAFPVSPISDTLSDGTSLSKILESLDSLKNSESSLSPPKVCSDKSALSIETIKCPEPLTDVETELKEIQKIQNKNANEILTEDLLLFLNQELQSSPQKCVNSYQGLLAFTLDVCDVELNALQSLNSAQAPQFSNSAQAPQSPHSAHALQFSNSAQAPHESGSAHSAHTCVFKNVFYLYKYIEDNFKKETRAARLTPFRSITPHQIKLPSVESDPSVQFATLWATRDQIILKYRDHKLGEGSFKRVFSGTGMTQSEAGLKVTPLALQYSKQELDPSNLEI